MYVYTHYTVKVICYLLDCTVFQNTYAWIYCLECNKYQIRPRKILSKIFWEEHAPTDPNTNEILNPLHYKFLATPLLYTLL